MRLIYYYSIEQIVFATKSYGLIFYFLDDRITTPITPTTRRKCRILFLNMLQFSNV